MIGIKAQRSGVASAVHALEAREADALAAHQRWTKEMDKLREDPTLTAPLGHV